MSATLKYDGPLPQAEVGGYGHFSPGEEKTVDDFTAAQFDCDPCKDEGWSVSYGDGEKRKKKNADMEATKPASDQSPRGPRNHATNNE
jgi:hypothetical protein